MFTGIVEELGVVKELRKLKGSIRLTITAGRVGEEVKIGDSVSVNGVCLTVVGCNHNAISFDVMQETAQRTNLGSLGIGDKLNLEQALKIGGRLGGHLVSGHIDGPGIISRIIKKGHGHCLEIKASREIMQYMIPKGSVALDGVGLTVGELGSSFFNVYIIPHTLSVTTLGFKRAGDKVNIEVDMAGKYMRKFCGLGKERKSEITEAFLKEQGFL